MDGQSKKRKTTPDDIVIIIKPPKVLTPGEREILLKYKYYAFFDLSLQSTENDEACAIVLMNPSDTFNMSLLNDDTVSDLFRSCCHLMNIIYKTEVDNSELITRILRARQLLMNKIINFPAEKYYSPSTPSTIIEISFLCESLRGSYTVWDDQYYAMVINYSVRHGYIGFLQFLIKYGKCNFLLESNFTKYYVTDFMAWMNEKLIDYSHQGEQSQRWHNIFMEFDRCLDEFLQQWNGRLNHRRSNFIILAMIILTDFERNERRKAEGKHFADTGNLPINCLFLVNQLIPEPFITYQDIKTFVSSFGAPYISYPHDLEIICKCLWDYLKKLLPKSSEFYNPRSLKDLACCRIRECIVQNAALPTQVSELIKSTPLKRFILFDNETIEDDLREEGIPQIKNFELANQFVLPNEPRELMRNQIVYVARRDDNYRREVQRRYHLDFLNQLYMTRNPVQYFLYY